MGSDPQQGGDLDYWKGAYRDTGRNEGATVVIQTTNKQGWFWYIPQHDDIVSVGVVGPFDYLFKGRGAHEETFNEEVAACPAVQKRIAGAERDHGILRHQGLLLSIAASCWEGWVLVGDAFGFLDPLYFLRCPSGDEIRRVAADAIADGLAAGDTAPRSSAAGAKTSIAGVDRMRRLVCEYYDGFSFGTFIRSASRSAQYGHRPPHRRPVPRPGRRSLGADGVPLPGQQPIPPWFAGVPPELVPDKANELVLPEGRHP